MPIDGKAIADAGRTFYEVYMMGDEKRRRDRLDAREEQARAFYQQLASREDARAEQRAQEQSVVAGQTQEMNAAKLVQVRDELAARANFLETQGRSFDEWQLMSEKDKFDLQQESQRAALEATKAEVHRINAEIGFAARRDARSEGEYQQRMKEAGLDYQIKSRQWAWEKEDRPQQKRAGSLAFRTALNQNEASKVDLERAKRGGQVDAAQLPSLLAQAKAQERDPEKLRQLEEMTGLAGQIKELQGIMAGYTDPYTGQVDMTQLPAGVAASFNSAASRYAEMVSGLGRPELGMGGGVGAGGGSVSSGIDVLGQFSKSAFAQKDAEQEKLEKAAQALKQGFGEFYYVDPQSGVLKVSNDPKDVERVAQVDPSLILDPTKVDLRYVGKPYPVKQGSEKDWRGMYPSPYVLPEQFQGMASALGMR